MKFEDISFIKALEKFGFYTNISFHFIHMCLFKNWIVMFYPAWEDNNIITPNCLSFHLTGAV